MAFFGPKLEGAVASSKNRRRIILERYISSFISFESNMKASESHETRFWQASSGREAQPRRRNQQTTAMQRGLRELEKRKEGEHGTLFCFCTAPNSKIQQKLIINVCICTDSFSKFYLIRKLRFAIVGQNSPILKLFSRVSAILNLRKISKSPT